MQLGVVIPRSLDQDPTELAISAEKWGYDSVWMGELWGTSSVVKLTEIACQTEEIQIGTAILNIYSRSPAVLAMTAATLDRISNGRTHLGVGPSTPTAIENIHGMEFERPARRAHETIELIQRLTSTEEDRINYDGELISVKGVPTLERDIPIYFAALGPANRRVVGRLCDGWIPHNIPLFKLSDAFEPIAETAREAGRDPDTITVAPYVPAAVSDDSEKAHNALRGHIAYYTSSSKGYRQAVATYYPDEAAKIAEKWQSSDRSDAIDLVTDDMVSDLGIAGTPEDARNQLHDLFEKSIIDHPLITIPEQVDDDLAEQTVKELSPSVM